MLKHGVIHFPLVACSLALAGPACRPSSQCSRKVICLYLAQRANMLSSKRIANPVYRSLQTVSRSWTMPFFRDF